MALIKCPECGKEISDRAASCPNCGCPISAKENNQTGIKKEELRQIEESSTTVVKTKNLKKLLVVIATIVAIAIIAVVIGVIISKKNIKTKREQQIQEVKNAMDNVDKALGDILTEIVPEEPFLYGDSISDSHKADIKEILDIITENQKIVEDAYENEDREFIKELDDYISKNKSYRSWDEYNTEIKKLYGNSISNEQAADNLVQDMASSEEDYKNFKNHYFYLVNYKGDGEYVEYEINVDNFDPEIDFGKISEKSETHAGMYYYKLHNGWIMYKGDEHPKDFTAKFKLLGTGGKLIAEQEWTRSSIDDVFNNGTKRKSYKYKNGFENGDQFLLGLDRFYSDINDTPTALVMEVTSGVE